MSLLAVLVVKDDRAFASAPIRVLETQRYRVRHVDRGRGVDSRYEVV